MAQVEISSEAVPAQTMDADSRYEIIDGQRQELSPMGAYENSLAFELSRIVAEFAEEHLLGRCVTETLFVLQSQPLLQLRPDGAFVSYARWPKGQRVPRSNAWDVVPDLAIEVISKNNFADEVPARLAQYFRAGVRRVWVVYPVESIVYDYESPTQVRILTRDNQLEGGALLPGFRLPLAQLFDETQPEPLS